MRTKWRRRLIPFLFLAYGLYSVFALQRDFQTIQRLMLYLVLLIPAFLLFSIAYRAYEDRERRARMRRFDTALHWASRSLTLNVTQYILIFCLPFFIAGRHWFYGSVNLLLLASLIWEPWWEKLVRIWVYRRIIQLWSLLCASSFLFPFVLPQQLRWFYEGLVAIGLCALLPGRWERRHILLLGGGLAVLATSMLVFPLSWRFPLLSIWLQKPHFETDTLLADRPHISLGADIAAEELKEKLAEGQNLCCVAPVIAPPALREKVRQEWWLDGRLLERPLLKTSISGNADQRAFRSYYCKQNFPALAPGQVLRCRVYMQDYLYLGERRLEIE